MNLWFICNLFLNLKLGPTTSIQQWWTNELNVLIRILIVPTVAFSSPSSFSLQYHYAWTKIAKNIESNDTSTPPEIIFAVWTRVLHSLDRRAKRTHASQNTLRSWMRIHEQDEEKFLLTLTKNKVCSVIRTGSGNMTVPNHYVSGRTTIVLVREWLGDAWPLCQSAHSIQPPSLERIKVIISQWQIQRRTQSD